MHLQKVLFAGQEKQKKLPHRWCKCIRIQREYIERLDISNDLEIAVS